MKKIYSQFWLDFCENKIELDNEFKIRDVYYDIGLDDTTESTVYLNTPYSDIQGNPINYNKV